MTTATAPAPTGLAIPANPDFRLKTGRIPDEYQLAEEKNSSLTGWWIEGFDLGDFDESWPVEINRPGQNQITAVWAKAWAKRFIESHTVFTVAGWTRVARGGREPGLTVTRHTLRIFPDQADDTTYWELNTLYAHEAQAIVAKLSDPDEVIELRDDSGVTYIPVRRVTSVRHLTSTEDVA